MNTDDFIVEGSELRGWERWPKIATLREGPHLISMLDLDDLVNRVAI